jgi:DNA ligase-1
LLIALSLTLANTLAVAVEVVPELMLASVYHPLDDISAFWVSEKLDGVRARWDGKQLVSRGGNIYSAPGWFIHGFQKQAMDGELWLGRGRYEELVSVVRQQTAHDGWQKVKFMVFDLPTVNGSFSERVAAMQQLPQTPYLAVIRQFRVDSNKALMDKLDDIVKHGGEGLMLHRQTARYQSGRSDDLLKLKAFTDADAVVIGHKPGQGKYAGLLGSIKVRTDNGKEFHIGSGFTLQQRKNPPPMGSLVTYRYQSFTKTGIPRFAVFIRQ